MPRSVKTLLTAVLLCTTTVSVTPNGWIATHTIAKAGEVTARQASRDAEAFIGMLGAAAIEQLTDASIGDDERKRRFRKLFNENFDRDRIARFVLGRHWRGASPEERREFLDLFETFVVEAYASRFKEYAHQTFEVLDSRPKKKDIWIDSRLVRAHGPAATVSWRLRATDDSYRVIDVVIEGISMAITQRDEFNAVISSNGNTVGGLNAALRKKLDL